MRTVGSAMLALLLLAPVPCPAAFEAARTGARQMSLGGSALAMKGDLDAGTVNPAGLAGLEGLTVAAWVVPGMFGVDGLNRAGCATGMPIAGMPIALQVSSLGFHAYRETVVSLSAAVSAGGTCALGLRLNCDVLSISGYGSTAVPTLDAGVWLTPGTGFSLAFLLTNVTAARIGAADESLPLSLAMGCAYAPGSAGVTVFSSCSREILSPLEWNAGVEYTPLPELTIRAGIATEPTLLCAGFGLRIAPFTFDYALTHHWQLGETHCLSLSITLD